MTSKTIFHSGLGEPEGPLLLTDGSWGVVEMSPETGLVSVISPGGDSKRVIVQTGRPNGMVQDSAGTLWVAESQNPPSLLKVGLDGTSEVVLAGGDGALYMTDSGVIRPDFQKARERESGLDNYPYDGKLV